MTDPVVKTPTGKSRIIGVLTLIATIGAVGVGHLIGQEGTKVVLNKIDESQAFSLDAMEKSMRNANAKVAGTMPDEITRVDGIYFDRAARSISYRYSLVNVTRADLDVNFASIIEAEAEKKACKPVMKDIQQHGYVVFYTYTLPDGDVAANFKLDCGGIK